MTKGALIIIRSLKKLTTAKIFNVGNITKLLKGTIAVLEAKLGLDAEVVYIQKPFLGNRSISHSGYNLYWLLGTNN